MFGLGIPELVLILAVLLLFTGKDRLPELARSIGKSMRELKSGFEEPPRHLEPGKEGKKETSDASGKQNA
jgi:TatA/E family protein of Tat protein translocase